MKILMLSLSLVASTVLAATATPAKSAKLEGMGALKTALEAQIKLSDYSATGAQNEKVRAFAARVKGEYSAFAADLEKLAPGEATQKTKEGGKTSKGQLVLNQLLETGKIENFTDCKYLAYYGKLQSKILTGLRSSLNTVENADLKALLEKELPILEAQNTDLKAAMVGKKK